ncbi:DEAD/DEAH box helicase [Ilumatobacter coccineus]|uniref:Putative ATP-dependent helicase n=1 Tax=Ilumatobacter coccineus (strain NBRC 103263 / KCTC 29153 / YM16-304) TaxID=1313172 RepID=A0A6C7EIN6_ILUCY|nr:DEAD/DEAH box helicase [Ilumatobacter coccineus]BAN04398.1 putative ATP-dependent helicase [Ilumatobacter coccineus YM16-304]
MSDFDRLHPSIRHHIVNTLGWPALRPLQEEAIAPVLDGEHGIFLAPTAGGKTEAATFPVLTTVANNGWKPVSVLYLAPLRALLNNLRPRLELYCSFVGLRVGLWHGDTTPGERTRMIADPPDILLTTPESLEAMLISRRVDQDWLFPNLHTVIVDEVHAFAGADRGWHLRAVLERLTHVAGRDLQRIGLSATVGNPDELLEWLCGSSTAPRRIVNPLAEVLAEPEVTLDYVGTLDNAATVISRLHQGEKRLVFVDSRKRAEELALALRALDVTTYLSHGSLGRDERRRSEEAFAEATNCVIVATSTLELGIDVGDLDRVIQIDSPPTVAGFLQRIGRTGRRPGSSRNALFLATSHESLLTAAGLLRLWATGYVEPATPPEFPAHLLVQQLLALTLQEAALGIGEATWTEWLGDPPALGADAMAEAPALLSHLKETGWIHSDDGVLSPGQEAERTVGKKNFLELTSVFVADPLLSVRHGRNELGQVPDIAITAAFSQKSGPPALLLGGRSWKINDVDWKRRIVRVEPTDQRSSVRFSGGAQSLGYELCQSIAAVLDGASLEPATLTGRAIEALDDARGEIPGARLGRSVIIRSGKGQRWYTFGGLKANLELAARLTNLRTHVSQKDNLYITLDDDVSKEQVRAAISQPTPPEELAELAGTVSGALKLERVLPPQLVEDIAVRRLRDRKSCELIADAPIDTAEA